MNESFNPPFYLKSTLAQTLLSSSVIRKMRKSPMLEAAQEVVLNPVDDVRLQGFYSKHAHTLAQGTVALLHGWEGSVNSGYMLNTGKFLYDHGYDVFRLNYRDHGETHPLNRGLFYAVLLEEVFQAVRKVSVYEQGIPFYVVGFSMGGNFALRIARKCVEIPIPNLTHVVSINPVLNPAKSTEAIDASTFLRKYFRKKWERSLRKKQASFPELYDFSDVLALDTVTAMTKLMLERYSDYKSASDYFSCYAVLKNALANVDVPLTIITAQDDPIIPVEDFYDLKLNSLTNLIVHRYGGHNGFIETLSGRAWYEQKLLQIFDT